MRLLLDEGVAWRTASLLRDRGIDTAHLFDLELGGATDATILDQAVDQHATIVTLDSDFHQLLALTGAQRPSVIRIRCEGLSHAVMADWILRTMEAVGEELIHGVAVSVNEQNIRIRKLPLGQAT